MTFNLSFERPPPASAHFHVVQQARPRMKIRFRFGDRRDLEDQVSLRAFESGGRRRWPASGCRDLACLGAAAWLPFRLSPSTGRRTKRLAPRAFARGYRFGMLLGSSTAVPSKWLCTTCHSSGPPSASAHFHVVQQANPSSTSRGWLRFWRDHAEQVPQRFACSVVMPPLSCLAIYDLAGSGKLGRAPSSVRSESLSLRPACRLGRSPHGCGSDVQFLLSTRGAFNMAPHNRSLQRTAPQPAELAR